MYMLGECFSCVLHLSLTLAPLHCIYPFGDHLSSATPLESAATFTAVTHFITPKLSCLKTRKSTRNPGTKRHDVRFFPLQPFHSRPRLYCAFHLRLYPARWQLTRRQSNLHAWAPRCRPSWEAIYHHLEANNRRYRDPCPSEGPRAERSATVPYRREDHEHRLIRVGSIRSSRAR